MATQPINNNAKINEVDPEDWKQIKCSAVPQPIPPPAEVFPTFISQYSEASPEIFGAPEYTFNITAPTNTDGALFVTLVQLKNPGVSSTEITVDGGAITDSSVSENSNPSGRENQMSIFEVKTLTSGNHAVRVRNIDGMDGVSIIAVYYKNFTGLTGRFSRDSRTGPLLNQERIGKPLLSSIGNRGLSVIFAGSLSNIASMTNPTGYDTTVQEFPTTDTGDNRYNGKLVTSVDLEFNAPYHAPELWNDVISVGVSPTETLITRQNAIEPLVKYDVVVSGLQGTTQLVYKTGTGFNPANVLSNGINTITTDLNDLIVTELGDAQTGLTFSIKLNETETYSSPEWVVDYSGTPNGEMITIAGELAISYQLTDAGITLTDGDEELYSEEYNQGV